MTRFIRIVPPLLISLYLLQCLLLPIDGVRIRTRHALHGSHVQSESLPEDLDENDSPSLIETSTHNFDPIYPSNSFKTYGETRFYLVPTPVKTTNLEHVYYTIDYDTLQRLQTVGIYFDGATGIFHGIVNKVTVSVVNIMRPLVARRVVKMIEDDNGKLVPTAYSLKQTQMIELSVLPGSPNNPRKPIEINGPTTVTGRFGDPFPDTAVWSVHPAAPVQWSSYISSPAKATNGIPYSLPMAANGANGRLIGRFPSSGNLTRLDYTIKASNADGSALRTITIILQPVRPSYLLFSAPGIAGNGQPNLGDGGVLNMAAGASANPGLRYIRVVPLPGSYSVPREMARFSISVAPGSPALPSGMKYTIHPTTGQLELDTTSAILKQPLSTRIRVTVTHPAGSHSIVIVVQIAPPPPTISFQGYMNGATYTLKLNSPVPPAFTSNPPRFDTTNSPPITKVSISPRLPGGLTFSSNSYTITGQCAQLSSKRPYVIEAATGYPLGSVKGTVIIECVQ